MAEQKQIVFTHREVAEALVRYYGLKEGLWGLYIELGIGGANIGMNPASPEEVVPAAIVPIVKLGIQRFDQPNSLTADAAQVKPKNLLARNSFAGKYPGKKIARVFF